MYFEVIGEISQVEVIARGVSVRQRARLTQRFGVGRWRKLKGVAEVRLPNGRVASAELHWFEARGIGRRDMKLKRLLEQ
jgi:hypothetical protein